MRYRIAITSYKYGVIKLSTYLGGEFKLLIYRIGIKSWIEEAIKVYLNLKLG